MGGPQAKIALLPPRDLPESKQRLVAMSHMPASLRPPSSVLMKEEISFLPLVYNIVKFIQKNNPGAHQDLLNAGKMKFQTAREHVGTVCGIHMSPEQQRLLLDLQGQSRPQRGFCRNTSASAWLRSPKSRATSQEAPGLGGLLLGRLSSRL